MRVMDRTGGVKWRGTEKGGFWLGWGDCAGEGAAGSLDEAEEKAMAVYSEAIGRRGIGPHLHKCFAPCPPAFRLSCRTEGWSRGVEIRCRGDWHSRRTS